MLEILAAALEGAEIGGKIGSLFDSPHGQEISKGIELFEALDLDDLDLDDVREIIILLELTSSADQKIA